MAQQYAALEQQRQALNNKQQYRTVYLVRHGSTELNHDDRIRGWSNVPLSSAGWKEVFALAKKLKSSNIGIIFSSDLDRAVGTASAISAQVGGVPIIKSQLLRPWNLGSFTGQPVKEVHAEIVRLAKNAPNRAPPSGESFNQFKARAFNGVRFALANSRGKPLAIVSHHRFERLMEATAGGAKPVDFAQMFKKGDPPSNAEKISFYLPAIAGAQPTNIYAGPSVIGPDMVCG